MKFTLKLLSTMLMLFILPAMLMAQAPQKFNYQGVARDAKGNPMSKQQLALKLSVLPSEDATVAEYEETQMVTTNEFGLYTLQIGNGTPISGTMKAVTWETGNKYIKVAIDPQGGTNYQNLGTTQLLSVPYALYADNAGSTKDRSGSVSTSASGTGTANYVTKFTAANTIYNSQIYDNGTNIGVGTTSPVAKLHINQNVAAVQEHVRMQNLSATGAGRFTMYSDGASNYSTFTKYGSSYPGGYAGVAALYPYGNLLAFGNNGLASGDGLGRFLISTAGNAGISIYKSGSSKLKFHADFNTLNVGIGGNSVPVARVHMNNTDGATMDMRLTNNTSGHTASDGLEISEEGTAARINNKENNYLAFGTNNTEKLRLLPNGELLSGMTSPLANVWYRSAWYQPNPGAGSALYLLTSDAGSASTDGAQISLTDGANPDLDIANREKGGISFKNTSSYTTRMRIDTNGNVGIGNENPISKLTVDNAITVGTPSVNSEEAGRLNFNEIMDTGSSDTSYCGIGLHYNGASNELKFQGGCYSKSDIMTLNRDSRKVTIGSGTPTSSNLLEVQGTVKINDGSQANGDVLKSDALGNATWADPQTMAGSIAGIGNLNGSSGGIIPATASTWTLFGPTATVTLTANQRVVMVLTSSLGKTVAGTSNFRLDIGYRPSTGTAVTNGSGGAYLNQDPVIDAGTKSVYTMSGSIKPGAGTWVIGAAMYAPASYFNSNDYCNGYYMIVNE